MLESVLELRRNQVATRQEVIAAEHDVELIEKELESATQRREACRRKTAPRAKP